MKIGFISDNYHLEKKSVEFVKYLKTKGEVSLYIEESFLLKDSLVSDFEEDLFFVKAKGELALGLIKLIEKTSIPVINSSKGIWNAIHRFLNSMLMEKAGVPVPDFSLNPIGVVPPFTDYIIKNIVDRKVYAFAPKIEKKNGQIHVKDERALNEAVGGEENYRYYFYQQFIKSKWEYKVYGIGEQLFFYKQLPLLVNPNKTESRQKIEDIQELKEIAFKAMEAVDLKIASIDFLKSKEGNYFLTDINCCPNFNYIKNGHKIVADYLIEEAKK